MLSSIPFSSITCLSFFQKLDIVESLGRMREVKSEVSGGMQRQPENRMRVHGGRRFRDKGGGSKSGRVGVNRHLGEVTIRHCRS